MVVFLVRVFLFLMSRQSGAVSTTADDGALNDDDQSHRTPSRKPSFEAMNRPLVPGDMGFDEAKSSARSAVTREEMVKLFGNALRVR